MQVLVASGEGDIMPEICEWAKADSRVRDVVMANSLTSAYDIAEHSVPDVIVATSDIATTAEFESFLDLLHALSIRCVIVQVEGRANAKANSLTKALRVEVIHKRELQFKGFKEIGAALPLKPAQLQPVQENRQKSFDEGAILLGASTGGVDALITVLSSFPVNCPPTFIVQHVGARFRSGLAELLDKNVLPTVSEADSVKQVSTGNVFLAPSGESHLTVKWGRAFRMQFEDSQNHGSHCPSIDALFHSAVPFADRVSAAILTGMGRDGASGLLSLRQSGARTFAQDAASSVVFGMPKAAYDAGGVEKLLPLEDIGPALLASRLVKK